MAFAQERSVRKKSEQTAATETRLALIIGNSDYLQTARLRNPVNDARSISKTLRDLGFSVTTLENAHTRGMDSAIRKFGKTLRKEGGVGLFYYAGHGMQIRGENYLLPVDINPSTETDVSYDAVPLGKLLGQMKMADNGMNVGILDACRNNPYPHSFRNASHGLATLNAPSGTFIAYATAPGSLASDRTGSNDLYT